MIKSLIKMFCKPSTLAKYAAQGLAKAVNESGKEEQIAKYGTMADTVVDIAKKLTEMSKDGKLDETETEQIQALIQPLFEKVVELI